MKTLSLIRTTLLGALEANLPAQAALSWGLGTARTDPPRVIVQPVGSGQPKSYIGMPLGWQGEIAIRAQAVDLDTAQALLSTITASLPTSYTITDAAYAPGWSLRLIPHRPIAGLTGPNTATAGTMYRAMLLPRMP